MHTHAFPDELAPRAIATLEAECPWKAIAGGTVGELLASMDAADVDVSVICTIATKPGQVKGIMKWCKQIRTDRLEPLPSVHPKEDKPGRWIEKFAKEGFVGIKLHPMYQDFAADDPMMDEIYAAAADTGLFVTVHCGKDIAFPPEDDRGAPVRFANVIERYPKLKLVCTHMGGWRMWEESDQCLVGSGAYLETSFSLDELDLGQAANMMRRHGIERVCFGTDWPWQSQKDAAERLRQLPLTKSELNEIRVINAARLLKH